MTQVVLDLGSSYPDFVDSPFMIEAAWKAAVNKCPGVTVLRVERYGQTIVVVEEGIKEAH